MALELIEKVEIGSNTTNVEFLNIPQDGLELQLFASARPSGFTTTFMTFNNNTNFIYSQQYGAGRGGSGTEASEQLDDNKFAVDFETQSDSVANTFANAIMRIPNYTSNLKKFISVDSVYEDNASFAEALFYGLTFNDTTAITSIQLESRSSYVANSTFYLYKVIA